MHDGYGIRGTVMCEKSILGIISGFQYVCMEYSSYCAL